MEVKFSKRTGWDLDESPLAEAIRHARGAGRSLIDLTSSNPTHCGLQYDAASLLNPLSDPAALTYDPDPRGIVPARLAVARYYADHQATIDPEEVFLTSSSSEAYSYLFRLLCDPGDEVLVARPSYPLFDFLADLDDVRLRFYPLFYDFGWWIDRAELERQITLRTRAIMLVHPNNPTGHATTAEEREWIEAVCARHGLALIVDEVFLDYGLAEELISFASGSHRCLTFILSGLSKVAALPQMKVGWLTVLGPKAARREAVARLEVIADTFLSVNIPSQLALESWLAGRNEIQQQILVRVRENLQVLRRYPLLRMLPVEAGWSAVLNLPQSLGSADLAERLVKGPGILVHSGTFYGMSGDHWVVISLLGESTEFERGVQQLARWCEPKELPTGYEGQEEPA